MTQLLDPTPVLATRSSFGLGSKQWVTQQVDNQAFEPCPHLCFEGHLGFSDSNSLALSGKGWSELHLLPWVLWDPIAGWAWSSVGVWSLGGHFSDILVVVSWKIALKHTR